MRYRIRAVFRDRVREAGFAADDSGPEPGSSR